MARDRRCDPLGGWVPTAMGIMVFGVVAACHTDQSPHAPATSATHVSLEPATFEGDWLESSTEVTAIGGYPRVTLRTPSTWVLTARERDGATVTFDPPGNGSEFILSAIAGPPLTDENVRDLEQRGMGSFEVLSPLHVVESPPDTRVFESAHRTPAGTLTDRFYVGRSGLVYLSFETHGPPDPQDQIDYIEVLREMRIDFGEGAASASASPCPMDVDHAGPNVCLEPSVLGPGAVSACADYLTSKHWVHDSAAEKTIGAQSGKTLICYRRP